MNEIIDKIENAKYKFAKTMPQFPHDYTLRETWEDQDFNEAVEFIRENGVAEKFNKVKYIYLYHNGYKYWTMGNPVEKTILINRAKV